MQRPKLINSKLICGDCLEVMKVLPENSVDLVFGSPPYEDARTYGIDFNLKGQEWVDWMVEVYRQSLRVCKGLVAFVVQGKTRQYKWSCTPALLMADLHRAGICVRESLYFHRIGIPGSGGPDDMRHDLEFIVRATKGGRLPWSDNKACGHPPKWGPGGECSHRLKNGVRVNQWGHVGKSYSGNRKSDGTRDKMNRPSHTWGDINGPPLAIANPGNVIYCTVGGGHIGSKLAHENEAPFPEDLAEFMIKSFCPPQETVLDPFLGSGTTVAVAKRLGRNYIGIDIRQSQIELTQRRLAE